MKIFLLAILAAVFGLFAYNNAAASSPEPQHVITDAELLAMSGDLYASHDFPLGDRRYVTDGPRKGYIYLCHPMNGGGGAQAAGNWIQRDSWNPAEKPSVQGDVAWAQAQFTNSIEGDNRILSGNGLPLSHSTGIFPVQPSDPAYAFDRNPNRIAPQRLHDVLPLNPVYSSQPFCMGGEAGIMLTGVPLFNGFDAGMRDAAAHEIQDRCGGHPQRSGEYHYHSLSPCFHDVGEKTVLGYALDGFPITGPMMAAGRYLTTAQLDECHGLTSEIIEDGQRKISYHYVMTFDFPYSVSCFRGQPTRLGPSDSSRGWSESMQQGMPHSPMRKPPPEALAACSGSENGMACRFTSPRGDAISGMCHAPPGMPLACMPMQFPMGDPE